MSARPPGPGRPVRWRGEGPSMPLRPRRAPGKRLGGPRLASQRRVPFFPHPREGHCATTRDRSTGAKSGGWEAGRRSRILPPPSQ
eukprot:15467428-Alexandrium_andersonii.AAC.1